MDTNPNFTPIDSTPPVWAGDYLSRETVMPVPAKLDAAQFNAVDAVVVKVTANRAVDAVQVDVAALLGPIPSGTTIPLGGKKYITLTADAPAGAVSLAVSALGVAIVTNDTGTYKGVGKKSLPSGTLIGRTFAERDAGTAWGPADVTTPDDEIYLTTRDLSDLTKDNTVELYRHNKVVKENYLPGWATAVTAFKNKVRALYACIGGKD